MLILSPFWPSPSSASYKQRTCLPIQTQVWSLDGKIPWRRAWQCTPVFLPGESHGQRSLEDYDLAGTHLCHYLLSAPIQCYSHSYKWLLRDFLQLSIQWLRICASTAGDAGFILGLGTKILLASTVWQKKKKKKRRTQLSIEHNHMSG